MWNREVDRAMDEARAVDKAKRLNRATGYVALLVISLIAIGLCGYTLYELRSGRPLQIIQVVDNSAGEKLRAVLEKIRSDYVDSVSLDSVEEAVLPALLAELDPHSEYFPAQELEAVQEPLRGDFEGIGVVFNMLTDTVIVQSVIAGGPSERAGIEAGDRIMRVDSIGIAGVKLRQDSVVRLLRGARGTRVRVEIARLGVEGLIPIEIVRDKIPLKSIEAAYVVEDGIGVIRLSRFAQKTPKEFGEALVRLSEQGMQRLILDLRGNGGGYLQGAHFVASQFLRKGSLITYIQGRRRARQDLVTERDGPLRNIPLVLLTDELSASSSEIVAGAMQDNDRAAIVGRRTFGKGLVQEQFEFPDGSGLRLTVSRYYTPSGRSIQKPYELGEKRAYNHDLEERWENGELYERDSIKLDTLRAFRTLGGRTVYGGGGIMPDVFVPLDTMGNSRFLREVSRRALLVKFAQRYLDGHREELKRFRDVDALQRHLRRQAVEREFLAYAKSEGYTPGPGEMAQSGEIILTQLHANIARGVLDNEGYYPIISSIDNTLQRGIELVKKKDPIAAAAAMQ